MNTTASTNWFFVGAAFALTWGMFVGYFLRIQRKLHAARMLRDSVSTTRTS